MKKHLSNCTPLWFLLLTCLVLLVVSSRIAKADACVDTMYASDGTPMERINGATCNTTGGGITYHPGQTCGSNIPVCYRSAGGV